MREEFVPAESSIIWSRDLRKQFGDDVVVKDIDFDIPAGSIFGFIGPSGCGKTTTIRLLTGVYLPTGGDVCVMGEDPAAFTRSDRERIGYLPQQFVHYPDLTVWENLAFSASIYGVLVDRKARMEQTLDLVELLDHRRMLVKNISGGMLRRLSLAAALVHQPELLFLDEPTAGIDPVLRRKFWDHFDGLRQDGMSLFVTTQYISEAVYCDLVGIMREGELLAVDTPANLRRKALGGEIVLLQTTPRLDGPHLEQLNQLPFVRSEIKRQGEGNEVYIVVDKVSTASPAILEWCRDNQFTVDSIQEYSPPFDDIYVMLLEELSDD